MASDTVTIDRAYFQTLVRRADLNNDNLAVDPTSVTVPKNEYDDMKNIARQYANLRQNLLQGGVSEDMIDLLTQTNATMAQENQVHVAAARTDSVGGGGVRLTAQAPPPAYYEGPRAIPINVSNYATWSKDFANVEVHEHQDWTDETTSPEDISVSLNGPMDGQDGLGSSTQPPQRPQFDRQCTRTILLTNLADGVTHADVTRVVRGGQLLDIFLRTNDRSMAVSFLHAVDARAFFDHVKKNDLYIRNKRVEIRWSDRQFYLPGHVASKIGIGATRNLVIRRCDPRITEKTIRDDLDHIHNLVVIKVEFIGNSCYISTNSVHNAMFARTCMMSRGKYKGLKIDWEPDECAQAIDRIPVTRTRKETSSQKKGSTFMTNRFHLLNLDNDEDDFHVKNSIGITA